MYAEGIAFRFNESMGHSQRLLLAAEVLRRHSEGVWRYEIRHDRAKFLSFKSETTTELLQWVAARQGEGLLQQCEFGEAIDV